MNSYSLQQQKKKITPQYVWEFSAYFYANGSVQTLTHQIMIYASLKVETFIAKSSCSISEQINYSRIFLKM